MQGSSGTITTNYFAFDFLLFCGTAELGCIHLVFNNEIVIFFLFRFQEVSHNSCA